MSAVHPKYPHIFNTQDPVILKSNIKRNYLCSRVVTNIVDNVPSKGKADLKYDCHADIWSINLKAIEVEKKSSSRCPLACRRAVHRVRLKEKKYGAKFERRTEITAAAYATALDTEIRRQNLIKMKEELKDLQAKLPLAEAARKEAQQDKPIKGLDVLQKKLESAELGLKEFAEIILELESYETSFKKDPQKTQGLNKILKKIAKPGDKKRQKLVKKIESQKAKSQSIAGGELKTEEDVQNALILARARFEFLKSQKEQSEKDIIELEKKHIAAVNAAKVETYENWMAITDRIKTLQNEISKAQNPFKKIT